MRFKKKETAQDVVVCCCILHNMRKMKRRPRVNTVQEIEHQNEICQETLEAEENFQNLRQGRRQPQRFRIQNFLIENYFH